MMLGWVQVVALLVAAQRLGELVYARRNESRLRDRGAVESGASHYPLFILLHGGWLLAIFLLVPADRAPSWPLLALFVLLQAGRIWVVATLGPYWTTRILSLPGAPLVRRGPYRWVRHPNYLIVTAEIAVLPLAFGAWWIALVFSIANALLLRHRIGVEQQALAGRG
ncbi:MULTISPECIES: isoprenylcysteine carboxyl methyltransferase family protein [Inquilinus]|uniref:Methyltransferase n=1 Tax=Inquilinus ginsengisoli TaxID=363840 RepID=A0ABU1JR00_9PROT|nr:isoprenylcysteine carboxylmethyltransferase family protein [Inquilinus ginsengisoli]MDR6289969.1 methyltransferase [Inquilinus ginsengisoli]